MKSGEPQYISINCIIIARNCDVENYLIGQYMSRITKCTTADDMPCVRKVAIKAYQIPLLISVP